MNKKRRLLLVLIPVFLALTFGFGLAVSARATEYDEDGIIEAGEVINDDLFIGGDTVEINGTVNGDVFAGGSLVKVNGTINGSLATGAQVIQVNGEVTGSIYAGSMTITLGPEASVGRNVYYGGFNLEAKPGSAIGRDLQVGAYQVLLSGEVGRNVNAGVGALEIDGKIGNDVNAEVAGTSEEIGPGVVYFQPGVEAMVPSGIRVAESAVIGGALKYRSSENQADTILSTPAGGISYEYVAPADPGKAVGEATRVGPAALVAAWMLDRVREFITLMILGGLLAWQLPGLLNQVSLKVEQESIPSFGWGLVTVLVVYLGAVLGVGLILAGAIFFGMVTLGELASVVLSIGFSSLGLVLAGFSLLVSYGSKLVVAYLVGRLLLKWLAPKYEEQAVWPMLIGVLIYTFLRAIPGFGLVIAVIVTLVGLGAIWLYFRDRTTPASVPAS